MISQNGEHLLLGTILAIRSIYLTLNILILINWANVMTHQLSTLSSCKGHRFGSQLSYYNSQLSVTPFLEDVTLSPIFHSQQEHILYTYLYGDRHSYTQN